MLNPSELMVDSCRCFMHNCALCSEEVEFDKRGYRNGEILNHLYKDHDLLQNEISDVFNCSKTTIKTWFNKNDISVNRYKYEMPEEELKMLYVEEERSMEDIAEYYGCSYLAVRNRIENYGIEKRKSGELASPNNTDYRESEVLTKLYYDEKMSLQEISDKYSVSYGTIKHHFEKNGIDRRGLSKAHKIRYSKQDKPYRDKETVETLYKEEMMTTREIADYFDVSQICITKALKDYNIEPRYAGAGGETYETKDGNYVRSSGERKIVNWFVRRNIDYNYEPNIDISPVPDFKVQGSIIEYWGMVANEEYRERMADKIDKYNEAGIEVVDLYPSDLDDLDGKLARFL